MGIPHGRRVVATNAHIAATMTRWPHFVTLDLQLVLILSSEFEQSWKLTLAREHASQEALIFRGFIPPLGRLAAMLFLGMLRILSIGGEDEY